MSLGRSVFGTGTRKDVFHITGTHVGGMVKYSTFMCSSLQYIWCIRKQKIQQRCTMTVDKFKSYCRQEWDKILPQNQSFFLHQLVSSVPRCCRCEVFIMCFSNPCILFLLTSSMVSQLCPFGIYFLFRIVLFSIFYVLLSPFWSPLTRGKEAR